MTWTARAATTVAVAFTVAACGGSLTVSKADVEKAAMQKLPAATGMTPTTVSCPSDLAGKVGSKITCRATFQDNATYGVVVTVSAVDGKNVNFEMLLDADGQNAVVANILKQNLVKQLGDKVRTVGCKDAGAAQVGQTATCSLTTSDGKTYPVAVTITKREGTQIQFNYKVGS